MLFFTKEFFKMKLTFQTLTIFQLNVNILYYFNILPYKMNDQFRLEVVTARKWYTITIVSIIVQGGFELIMLKSVFDIKKYGVEHFVFCFACCSMTAICSLAQVLIVFRYNHLASTLNTFFKLNETFCKYIVAHSHCSPTWGKYGAPIWVMLHINLKLSLFLIFGKIIFQKNSVRKIHEIKPDVYSLDWEEYKYEFDLSYFISILLCRS